MKTGLCLQKTALPNSRVPLVARRALVVTNLLPRHDPEENKLALLPGSVKFLVPGAHIVAVNFNASAKGSSNTNGSHAETVSDNGNTRAVVNVDAKTTVINAKTIVSNPSSTSTRSTSANSYDLDSWGLLRYLLGMPLNSSMA